MVASSTDDLETDLSGDVLFEDIKSVYLVSK